MGKFKDSSQLIIRSLRRYISLSFILALMIFIVRFYELAIISNFSQYPQGSTINILIGFKYDLIFYLRFSGIIMIPFLIIAYFNQKAAKYFFIVLSILLILSEIILLQYFNATRVPLGADLLKYSLGELQHAVIEFFSVRVFFSLMIVLFLSLMVIIFINHVYYRIKPWAIVLLTILMFSSLLPIKQLNPEPLRFSDEFSYFVATNKIDYLAKSVINYYLKR